MAWKTWRFWLTEQSDKDSDRDDQSETGSVNIEEEEEALEEEEVEEFIEEDNGEEEVVEEEVVSDESRELEDEQIKEFEQEVHFGVYILICLFAAEFLFLIDFLITP